jgi:hypothetical protein
MIETTRAYRCRKCEGANLKNEECVRQSAISWLWWLYVGKRETSLRSPKGEDLRPAFRSPTARRQVRSSRCSPMGHVRQRASWQRVRKS